MDHWVGMYTRNASQKTMVEIAAIAPNITGIQKRYRWNELFDATNTLDLSEVQSDAVVCATLGLKFNVMIEDKTFDGSNPVPQHLKRYAVRTHQGYTAQRWHPAVEEAFLRTIMPIHRMADVHSVSLQETALGIKDADLDARGYTPERYADLYIHIVRALETNAPDKPVLWYYNYMARDRDMVQAERVLTVMLNKGNGQLGGADILPNNWTLRNGPYTLYPTWKSQGMTTFCTASKESYAQKSQYGYLTPEQILTYGKQALKLSSIIWMYLKSPAEEGSYDFFDALPAMTSQTKNEPLPEDFL